MKTNQFPSLVPWFFKNDAKKISNGFLFLSSICVHIICVGERICVEKHCTIGSPTQVLLYWFFFYLGIRILVTLLLDTLPMLGNVFILCVLILMVFAIIGVQLWHGILRNRCGLIIPDNMPAHFRNLRYSIIERIQVNIYFHPI